MASKSSCFWIVLALALYLTISLTFLNLPGLYYDETNFVNSALGATHGNFVAWSAGIFGEKVPLMIMGYIGALKSGLYAPIFKFFGCSAITVRLPVVLIGLITLLAAYGLFRRLFDNTIALIGLGLFATDCTFIFANRLDWGPVSLMLALEMSSLYCMWRWMTDEDRRWLALAGFLFGLGLYNKIIFIWIIAAFFASLLLCFPEKFKRVLHWRQMLCLLPAFVLGCLPLIAYNIDIPLGTFRGQPVMTFPTVDALLHRYELAKGTLDGSGVYYLVNYNEVGRTAEILKAPPTGNWDAVISAIAGFSFIKRSTLPYFFFGAIAIILILSSLGRLEKKPEILFMGSQFIVIAFLICLNANATGAHHLIAFYPFVFILISYAICELGRRLFRSKAGSGILIGACLLPVLIPQIVVDARYLKSFQAKGGYGFWSDAVYGLGSFVRENPDRKFILMEWGLTTQLILLSNGKIRYEDFRCEQTDLEACMKPLMTRTNTYMVFYSPLFEEKPLLAAFKNALARNHLRGRIAKTFYQRDGRPVYVAYEIVPRVMDEFAGTDKFYYMREAEDFDDKQGGDLDKKEGASHKKALGLFWGRRPEDFATYRFSLPGDMADVRLYVRYAFEDRFPHEYYLLLDGNFIDSFTLQPTAGYGYTADQWKIFEIKIGAVEKGPHELKLKPGKQHQVVNLDYWYLCDGPFNPARSLAGK